MTQKLSANNWEIYLEEPRKGRIPLSHTGSGLKTIILVLAFLHLVPRIEGKKLSSYLFGFEELENNLHPALQRRLLLYLKKYADQRGPLFFLTTHSSVAIDLFSTDSSAQILHVTHDGSCAAVKPVTTYVDNRGIIDDLDIRASDLLQSNGIIWVEGPSDRLYFNRWIELWSDGELKEGAHYQCVPYGGRLLSHLSAADPDVNANDVVRILRVNRNALLLIDSDARKAGDEINPTKRRLVEEIETIGGKGWVTHGKEIENYIPERVISAMYGDAILGHVKRYQDFSSYLDRIKLREGRRFLKNKVLFAEKACQQFSKNDLFRMDLADRLDETCSLIRKWNGLT